MSMPVREQFNNSVYYRQKLPAELANSRLWQLVYGEFRAPMYMAVLRDRLEKFAKSEFNKAEALTIIKYLHVWACISDNRRVEWETVRQLARAFGDRLLETAVGITVWHTWGAEVPVWIDDDAEWDRVVIQPYQALQR